MTETTAASIERSGVARGEAPEVEGEGRERGDEDGADDEEVGRARVLEATAPLDVLLDGCCGGLGHGWLLSYVPPRG